MAIVYGIQDKKTGQVLGSFWRKLIQAKTHKNDQCYLLNCNDDRFKIVSIDEEKLKGTSFIIREYYDRDRAYNTTLYHFDTFMTDL